MMMKQIKDLQNLFLCGIAAHGVVYDFRVGTYCSNNEVFKFSNGSYSPMELSKEPMGSNATYVKAAISLDEIDDAGLLYKYEDNI